MLQITGVVSESTERDILEVKLFSSLCFHVQIDTVAGDHLSN